MEKALIQHLSCKTGTPLLQLTEWVEDWEARESTLSLAKKDKPKEEELFEVKLTKSELYILLRQCMDLF